MHLRQAVVSPQSRFANSVSPAPAVEAMGRLSCARLLSTTMCVVILLTVGSAASSAPSLASKLRPDEHKGSTVVSGRLATMGDFTVIRAGHQPWSIDSGTSL